MLQKIKTALIILGSFLVLSTPLLVTGSVAMAAEPTPTSTPKECLQQGSNLSVSGISGNTGVCTPGATEEGGTLNNFIAKVLNVLSIVVGVIAVVMIIVGGFRYTASGGKEEGIKGAKNSILYALIGLIIVALAQIIVRFVLNKTATGL